MDHNYCLQLVKNNGNRIVMVPDEMRDEEIRQAAIRRTPTAIQHISNPTVDEQLLAIHNQGDIDREGIFELVEMIGNIDQSVLDATIDVNGNCIGLIKDPSEDQITRAVSRDGDAIKHIEDPNLELQMLCIRNNPKNISFVANPMYEIVEKLIADNPRSIEFVKEPHRDHQLSVLTQLPNDGLHYLNKVDDDIALKHITENPDQIELLQNQTEECCWAVLMVDGSYIKKIRNPTPEMESYAQLVSDGD